MFEDKRVVISGWIASGLLGFLAGAAVFWTPSPRTAETALSAPVVPRPQVATDNPAPTTGGALTGSAAALPFTVISELPATAGPPGAASRSNDGSLPENAQGAMKPGGGKPEPVITVNGLTLQGDTVLAAPTAPNDERRRVRMSIDVSTIP